MEKRFKYTEEEINDLLRKHDLLSLTAEEKLKILSDREHEYFAIVAMDLGYHYDPDLVSMLVAEMEKDSRSIWRVAGLLGDLEINEAAPA